MALESIVVKFGEWLPDQAALGNPQTVVKNAIPQANSYASAPGADVLSADAIASRAFTGYWCMDQSLNFYFFAGCETKLYQFDGSGWTDVSQAGDYVVENRKFILWGERVIAIGDGDVPQYFDLGSSTDFADLSGATAAICGAVVGDFIMLGGGTDPANVRWSGYNNSTAWTPSPITQSDTQTLFGVGTVVKEIVPQGNSAVIFCDRSIRVATYVGPPLVFKFETVEEDRGTLARNSIAWSGNKIFYYGLDGFYVFSLGQGSVPIGMEKVDRFFQDDFDFSRMDELRGAIDRRYEMVCWSYPSLSSGGYRILCYRWMLQKWSYIDADLETIFDYNSGPTTVDGLDSTYATVEDFNISVDSSSLAFGSASLGGFNTSHKLASLTNFGSPFPISLETGEANVVGKRTSVKSVRPLIDGEGELYVGTRDNQDENFTYGTAIAENAIGEFDVRSSARYHRFKFTSTNSVQHAQGFEVFFRKEGRR